MDGHVREVQRVERLRAELVAPDSIRIRLDGPELPRDRDAYRLTDGGGTEIAVMTLRSEGSFRLLVPASPLDPRRVHYVEIPSLGLRALARRESFFRALHSDRALGASVSPDGSSTAFRVFAPRADAVRLYLYEGHPDEWLDARETIELARHEDGVWEVILPGDLHGTWYDFTVHGPPDPGNRFHETHPVHISDPYARVQDEDSGRSRVWRRAPPPVPLPDGRPAMRDVVAYEVHVQDFTDLLPVSDAEVGTLPAMVRPGLQNSAGEPIGFDHLVDLGVNVVHLMPVQEFFHYPDDVWQAAFADDPFAREMGIDRENYQWGYRTTHAFAVESRYRSRDAEPGVEREQFRTLVSAFHQRGIAVVIDVVPNHTGEDMDERHRLLHFNVLDLPYYHRTDEDLEHIGPFGNELKTEDRPMVQRWLLDQLRHWVEEMGVDGFRIDLAGQIDAPTLRRVCAELPDDLLIYGEPWIPPTDPDVAANPEWSWYKLNAPITFFQDAARNAFKGSPFDVTERGWAGGDGSARAATVLGVANAYPEEPHTTNGISYLDIHDNWTLADRYALRDYDGRQGVDLGAVRIAAGLLLTSAGPVVIHGGTEMLRSKGLAPLEESVREFEWGRIRFRGRHDTYNLRAPNRFLWESLVPGSDSLQMRDYWRGLIRLRMSEYGAVFRIDQVPDGHYRFVLPDVPTLLGYAVGGRVLVLANSGLSPERFRLDVAEPAWRQVGSADRVDLSGVDGPYARLAPGPREVEVPAGAFLIWVRD